MRTLVLLIMLLVASAARADDFVATSSAMSIKITWRGKRYLGLATKAVVKRENRTTTQYSAVILLPEDTSPDVTVSISPGDKLGVSIFRLQGGDVPVIGRFVGVTSSDGTSLTLFPRELPETAYKDMKSLARAVLSILSGPTKPAGPTGVVGAADR